MNLDYKILSTVVGILITFVGYIYYIREIYAGDNKPHMFSWLIWGLALSIGFFIQFFHEGGVGSYITFFEAFFCFLIAIISIKKGEKNITISDKIYLGLGFVSIFFWLVLKQPIISVLLIILIDFFGFLPTFRKSYIKPYEESVSVYIAGGIIFSLAIIGLSEYSFLTYAYPLVIVVLDTSLVFMILIRRKILS